MDAEQYYKLKGAIIEKGFKDEILSAEDYLKNPCENSEAFYREYIWVVINSGMKMQIAEVIFQKVIYAIKKGYDLNNIFGHQQKVKAILYMGKNKDKIFQEYLKSSDKISYLESLPYIGGITKYHLARNLGIDICKPDRHLTRISKAFNLTPESLCKSLAIATQEKVGVIDMVLWRAGNLRLI